MDFFRIPSLAAIDKANSWTGKHVLIDRRYNVYSVVIFVFEMHGNVKYLMGSFKESSQMKMAILDINVFYLMKLWTCERTCG